MKVKMIKPHPFLKGTVEVEAQRGLYLISVGAAEEATETKEEKPKEKQENKTANVPSAIVKKGKT